MLWDFSEVNPISGSAGGLDGALQWVLGVCETNFFLADKHIGLGQTQQANAAHHPLPDDFIQGFISDPPYYDSIEYSDLSDFFYVWLKRTLPKTIGIPFNDELTPKEE
ncbi:hypothetical protein CBP22_18515, partial [Fischerella thermalis WC249]